MDHSACHEPGGMWEWSQDARHLPHSPQVAAPQRKPPTAGNAGCHRCETLRRRSTLRMLACPGSSQSAAASATAKASTAIKHLTGLRHLIKCSQSEQRTCRLRCKPHCRARHPMQPFLPPRCCRSLLQLRRRSAVRDCGQPTALAAVAAPCKPTPPACACIPSLWADNRIEECETAVHVLQQPASC